VLRRTAIASALSLGVTAPTLTQALAQPAPPETRRVDPSSLPPALVLGARAQAVQRAQRVIPVVVLVSDPASFADAVAAWNGQARYPVLFDDGSDHAAEQIGRFVRRFAPDRVVRFTAADREPDDPAADTKPAADPEGVIKLDRGVPDPAPDASADAATAAPEPPAWPDDADERAARITDAWLGALGVRQRAHSRADALAIMTAHGYQPAGVVAIDPRDPAWVAGLAIAAARLCPIIYVDFPGASVDSAVTNNQANAIANTIESGLDTMRLPWRELGDAVDAVTLVGDCPARIRVDIAGKRANLAMTDRIGRQTDEGAGARWAWAGQIFGSETDASYSAMCGLFLPIERAWIFDGYPIGLPWSAYDGTEAADALRRAGLTTTLFDTPNNENDDWRLAVARGVDADLALINSKGASNYFQTNTGYLRSGDAPLFDTPAAVHMVHSFALELPGNTRTVGARFLDHGAYAFIGSVHEPYLSAFVPTPIVARRLAAGVAWGAAGRLDAAPVWKIAVIGDPLMTIGPRGERTADALPLAGAADLDEERARAVRDADFALAVRDLVLSGRDDDAGRLAEALWAKTPMDVGPEIAAPAIGAALRTDRPKLAVDLFERLDDARRREPSQVDTLWNASRTLLARGQGETAIGVMSSNLRDGQQANDAAEIASHIARIHGNDAALAYLTSARDQMPSDSARDTLDKAAARLRKTRRP